MSLPNDGLDRLEALRKRLGFWVDALRVRQILTWLLVRIPVRVGSSPTRVRIRCWSDILAFIEIFRVGIYDPVFDGKGVETYCDLGCQSGLALLRLGARSGPPKHAVLVDGNPLAVKRCRENVRLAGVKDVHVVHGAVGCDRKNCGTFVQFTVRPNELECALGVPNQDDTSASAVDVPVIDLEKLWLESVGDVPCDLLKMDIEGAELGVLRYDSVFLARVRRCVLEWHDPPASRDAVSDLLQKVGFTDITVICQGEKSGVLYCQRVAQGSID